MITNEQNLSAYNKIARIYAGDKPEEDDPVMRRACRELFYKHLAGKKVLEIGCGPGTDSHYLQQMGLNVTATDFSGKFVQIVKERYPTLTVRQMDMTSPDLPEISFDGIYGFACFIHIPRKLADQTLSALRRLLVPGGILFLGMIKSTKVNEYIIPNWCGMDNNPVLFTCYDEAEIESRLKKVGFEHVEFHTISSEVYEKLPRLIERGVSMYKVIAKVGESL
jgi:2-polyprenyl-3-methyl-5-hydroxy-6-metoxy-1,4-benzoquinol methylase